MKRRGSKTAKRHIKMVVDDFSENNVVEDGEDDDAVIRADV